MESNEKNKFVYVVMGSNATFDDAVVGVFDNEEDAKKHAEKFDRWGFHEFELNKGYE